MPLVNGPTILLLLQDVNLESTFNFFLLLILCKRSVFKLYELYLQRTVCMNLHLSCLYGCSLWVLITIILFLLHLFIPMCLGICCPYQRMHPTKVKVLACVMDTGYRSGVRYQLPCCCQSGKCPWQQGTASLKVTSLSKTDDWLVQGPNRLPQCGTMLKGHPAPESSIQSAEATAVTAPQLNQPCLLTSLAFLTSTHVYLPGTPINTASLGNSWSQRLIPEIPITSSPSNPFS